MGRPGKGSAGREVVRVVDGRGRSTSLGLRDTGLARLARITDTENA